MKFGERLNTFSVPEWRMNNILYDELKLEIKELTSSSDSFNKPGYNRLVESFKEEIKSINLFTQCKLGEIDYRFKQCQQELNSPKLNDSDWQISSQIHRLNQEIYNLSRFIAAQFTGFKKLLKKYKRHAPPNELSNGFDLSEINKLLYDQDSFASIDLTKQFYDLSNLYKQLKQRANETINVVSSKKLLDFDAQMLQHNGDVYKFWVHKDNLVQLKVLLLQHMDLVCSKDQQNNRTYIDFFDNLDNTEFSRQPAHIRSNKTKLSKLLVPVSGMRYMSTNLTPLEADSLLSEDNLEENNNPCIKFLKTRNCKPILKMKVEETKFKLKDDVYALIYSNVEVGEHAFLYCYLEIRTSVETQFLNEIRDSYLVYPVSNDFSLYAWALFTLNLKVPSAKWFDDLEQGVDIKRLPPSQSKRIQTSKQRNLPETLDTEPEFRYWNEFDDDIDEVNGNQNSFLNEIDEELQRARTAARLAQPVYQLSNSINRKLLNWFDKVDNARNLSNSNSDLESNIDGTSITSNASFETDIMSNSSRFSPRIHTMRSVVSEFNGSGQRRTAFTRSHTDAALSLITFLCFSLSLAIVVLVFTILLTEDLTLLAVGLRVALVLFLLTSLSLSLLGYIANNFRSEPGWLSQALVHTALLCVVCLAVGGIANVVSPFALDIYPEMF